MLEVDAPHNPELAEDQAPVSYAPADVPTGMTDSQLGIYYWDPAAGGGSGAWTPDRQHGGHRPLYRQRQRQPPDRLRLAGQFRFRWFRRKRWRRSWRGRYARARQPRAVGRGSRDRRGAGHAPTT